MGYPELAADTAALHETGKAFTRLAGEGRHLGVATRRLAEAEVPDQAFGYLPMSFDLRGSYEEALESHKRNLDIARKYLSDSGVALQQVSTNIRKAEEDSTL